MSKEEDFIPETSIGVSSLQATSGSYSVEQKDSLASTLSASEALSISNEKWRLEHEEHRQQMENRKLKEWREKQAEAQ